MKKLKELKDKYLTQKVRTILSIVVIVLGTLWFIDYSFNKPTYINEWIATKVYKTPANNAFTDQNFYKCVIDKYNYENNTNYPYSYSLSDNQLKQIEEISCSSDYSGNIASTKGIEKLTNLKELYFLRVHLADLNLSKNTELNSIELLDCYSLSELDITKNTKLKKLEIAQLVDNDIPLSSLDTSKNTLLEKLELNCGQMQSIDVRNNTALTYLSVGGDKLSNIDISKNTELKTLSLGGQKQVKLNLENNKKLETLSLGNTQIQTLDLRKNTALKSLYLRENFNLTKVDVSENAKLLYIDAYKNQLTSLVLGNNPQLKSLEVSYNQLTSLDASNKPVLTELHVENNNLTSLKVGGDKELYKLHAQNNQITGLNASNLSKLEEMLISENQLTSINVDGATSLKRLYVYNNQLASLDVSKNTALTYLKAGSNQLTSLDVSKNTNLEYLDANDNQLKKIDVSKKTKLEQLKANKNKLTSINVAGATSLKTLDISNNLLGSLSISNNKLEALTANNNKLTSINVAGATSLKTLDISNNLLNSLSISNNKLETLTANNNKLTSINVAEATSLKTLDISNNLLNSLSIDNNKLERLTAKSNKLASLDVSNNTALKYLNVNYNQLTSLNVSNKKALTHLYVGYNQLTSLDVSKNTALTNLDVNYNQLTSLNVSKNTALTNLDAWHNQLTSLDVSKNTALKSLNVSNNQLTSLDVSNNKVLENLYVYDNQLTSLNVSKNTKLDYIMIYWPHSDDNFISEFTSYVGGKTKIINPVILPNQFDKSITWSSNDKSVATVDKNGNITCKDKGTAIIYGENKYYTIKTIVNVFRLESDKYIINEKEGYVYVGADSDAKTIKNKLSVPDYITPIVDTANNTIILKNGSTVLKEFDIVRISSDDYSIKSQYINIKTNNKNLDKLTCYNCTASIVGNEVVIKYNNKEICRYKLVNYTTNYPLYKINNGVYIYAGIDSEDAVLDSFNTINCEAFVDRHRIKISYDGSVIDSLIIQYASSKDYILKDDYVFTKTENFDISKVTLYGGLSSQVKNGKFYIYYSTLTDRDNYNILSAKINNMPYDGNNIYVSENVSYNNFISNLSKVGNITFKVYNGNSVVTSGNIEGGMQLAIIYNNKEIYRYNINCGYEIDFTGYDVRGNYIYLGYSETGLDINSIPTQRCTLEWRDGKVAVIYNGNVVKAYTVLSYNTDYSKIGEYLYVGALSNEEILWGINATNGITKELKNKASKLVLSYNNEVLGEYELVRLKSTKYSFPANGVIYTGADSDEETILNNLIVTNGDSFIENNKVKVRINNTVADEAYEIRHITFNGITVKNKEIEVASNTTSNSLLSRITPPTNMTVKVFDEDMTEITGNNLIEEGYILKVQNGTALVDTFTIKVIKDYLEISSELTVDEENKIIYNIAAGANLNSIINRINTSGNVVVKDKNNNVITNTKGNAKTGDKIIITLSSRDVEYKLSVKGDVTGTGTITIADVMKLAKYSIHDIEVEGKEFFKAADVTGDGNINISDVMKLAKSIVDKTGL